MHGHVHNSIVLHIYIKIFEILASAQTYDMLMAYLHNIMQKGRGDVGDGEFV